MHPPSADKDGRQDVLLLKQQLAEALGENGPSYWQALTDFVQGKLNRQEFDFYANLYLSRKNAPLHNQFILANIHNAQKEAPPPSKGSVGWGKGKRGKDGKLLREKDPKRRKMKNQILSLGKAERERIKGLKETHKKSSMMIKQRLKEHRVSRPMAPTVSQPALIAEYNRGNHAPLCFDSKELPNFESMRDRMVAVAMENGLMSGVQEGAVELMLHALESHIKNIISNCIIKLRSNRALGITVPRRDPNSATSGQSCSKLLQVTTAATATATVPAPTEEDFNPFQAASSTVTQQPLTSSTSAYPAASYNNSGHNTKRTTTITAKDLAFTIDISPNMLVENPVNIEKLMSILMEEESEEEDEDAEMDDQDELSDSMIEF
ncbi:hypothetical protein BX616_004953 [Lobosporangium transversale]|uniref:Transcriptional regulator of RNA polII, SAGA, subunit-domain-containing protein n=1 Tax=Lobosporangium transversale TaxID=64571 RepID=A0A1Y2G8U3_9FUNG|nr:transcriptional regulator of RNA polII, SAGA, subunit-domain-containing protein [Lobosporangium transversale]KAF9897805.1 hypothetical protein BX616_004953 [Lobosporangium transversale]ORZ04331.1 transcriptional regulator of RNA polII, SAGA, subunit-domain-containing protein [Lobosporangium transversale]|eukprot:XP_021876489.1 transcriptional regulator of RNA polII, SAGA, subunit-domain-containing protein [Lobosporangium transversale]